MTIILLIIWGTGLTYLARLICGQWLNHLSLYTCIWTLSLSAYELHWIRYNSISAEAWLYIFLAWISIYIGTAVAMGRRVAPTEEMNNESLSRLRVVIIVLGLAGLASCVVLAREIMKDIDQNLLLAVTVGAPKIYAAAFEETGQFAGIPYLEFVPFAASALAGTYAAKRGRLDWVCIFPFTVAIVTGVLSASRWEMLFAGVLFMVAFRLTPKSKPIRLNRIQKGLLVLTCAGGIFIVSLARTDLTSSLADQQSTLTEISDWVPVAPSLYFYLSGPPVGLSEYLDDSGREANLPWGRYTFASVYRFLSKLGLSSYVPFHQDFYSTPEPINTCTYLREVHSDFGVLGVFLFPFLMGLAAEWASCQRGSLSRLMLLTYLYVVILFSSTDLVMAAGQWFQGLIVSIVAALLLQRASRLRAARAITAVAPRAVT